MIEKRVNGNVIRHDEVIEIKEIELPSQELEAAGWHLDAASKLDRSKEFLEMLMHAREKKATEFMAGAV